MAPTSALRDNAVVGAISSSSNTHAILGSAGNSGPSCTSTIFRAAARRNNQLEISYVISVYPFYLPQPYHAWCPPLTRMLFQTTTLKIIDNKKNRDIDLLASGTESRGVGCQPSDHTSQFIRPAKSAERVQARPLVQQVRLRVHIRRGHTAKQKAKFRQHTTAGPGSRSLPPHSARSGH